MRSDDLLTRILYRDDDLLILDKPAGLAVHAAPGAGETLEKHLGVLRFEQASPPLVSHRLDRETSGCLVLARHDTALRHLNALFAAQAVDKTYWAVVEGVPSATEGMIDAPLLKVHRAGRWSMVIDPAGQTAQTVWRVISSGEGRALVEVRPLTGRTHQIRVHCRSMGIPIVGDLLYGRPAGIGERLHLHARKIAFNFGVKAQKRAIAVEAEPPAHMGPALRRMVLATS